MGTLEKHPNFKATFTNQNLSISSGLSKILLQLNFFWGYISSFATHYALDQDRTASTGHTEAGQDNFYDEIFYV